MKRAQLDRKTISIWHSVRGMTLVELMIAGALFSMVSMGVSAYFLFLSRSQTIQYTKSVIAVRQQEIIRNLMDDRAWTNTLNDPANTVFTCLFPAPPAIQNCRNVGDDEISIQDRSGNYVVEHSGGTPMNGFDRNGQPCNFVAAGTNDRCPFRFIMRAEPLCRFTGTVTRCTNVNIKVTAQLVIAAREDNNNASDVIRDEVVNPRLYNFWMFRQTLIPPKKDVFEAAIQFASGTVGGTCPTSPVTRTGWVEIGSSEFGSTDGTNITLATDAGGAFHCRIVSTIYGAGHNRARINFSAGTATTYIGGTAYTAGSGVYYGTSEYAGITQPSHAESVIEFVAELDGGSFIFNVAHLFSNTPTVLPDRCLGKPVNSGSPENYAKLRCERLDMNF